VIIFNNLQLDHINKIIDIELEKLFIRTNELGYEIKLSKKAKDFIAEKGFDKQYGARPLKRAIQKYLEDELAEEIMKSKVQTGDVIKVDLNKDKTKLILKTLSKKKTTKK
jgi:ATP-dependent Clp protease ATP-binding subunit ClpC